MKTLLCIVAIIATTAAYGDERTHPNEGNNKGKNSSSKKVEPVPSAARKDMDQYENVMSIPDEEKASPEDYLAAAGYTKTEIILAQKKLKAACPNGINPEDSLTKEIVVQKNKSGEATEFYYQTVETEGKCFEILRAEFVHLFDNEKDAMYQVNIGYYSKPLIYVEFPAKHTSPLGPHRTFSGIIKGVDTFKYKDGRGIPKTAPHVIVVQGYDKFESPPKN